MGSSRQRQYDVTLELSDGSTVTVRVGANVRSTARALAGPTYRLEHPDGLRWVRVSKIAYVPHDQRAST